MVTRKMIIEDMQNQADVSKISQALHDVWGIRKVEVSLDRKEATFSFDETAASLRDFREAVVQLGYEVTTKEGTDLESLHDWHLEQKAGESVNANDL
jgi:copper chaperone